MKPKTVLIACALLFVVAAVAIRISTPSIPSKGDDSILACMMTQKFVKARLKTPTAARFVGCNRDAISYAGNGEYIVTGYVDSQNSFGAQVRTHFAARLQKQAGNAWKLLNLEGIQP